MSNVEDQWAQAGLLMKRATLEQHRILHKLGVRVTMQVHDELLLELPEGVTIEQVLEILHAKPSL